MNVAYAVRNNFDMLPENTRNELLIKLAKSEYVAGGVANTIDYNFDKLPENAQNLLFKLADNKDALLVPFVFSAMIFLSLYNLWLLSSFSVGLL